MSIVSIKMSGNIVGFCVKTSILNRAIIREIKHCRSGLFTLAAIRCLHSKYPQLGKKFIFSRLYTTDTNSDPNSSPEASDSRSTISQEEVDKFSRISQTWWNESGEFKALHSLNKLRVPLIRDGLLEQDGHKGLGREGTQATQNERRSPHPLRGFKILDVGCGGGILSEPLARLGADVTGVDASEENIAMAEWHSKLDPVLVERLSYTHCAVEDLVDQHQPPFDGVVASEIIEHVTNQQTFIEACCKLVKPGGSLFITTMNKTWLSYYLAVVAAERLLNIVPAGAHDWNKFVEPSTVQDWLSSNGFHTLVCHGMTLNPLSNRWSWITDTSINYALHAVKLPHNDS